MKNPLTALYCTISSLSKSQFPQIIADFQHSHIVGYMNTTANTSTKAAQYNMMGCAFLTVGVDNGCEVTDLKFDGYQNITAWKTAGGFSSSFIQIINNKGVATAKFTWVDEYDKVNTVWLGGYWRNDLTGKKVVETVSDPTTEEAPTVIPVGTGLWCNVGKGAKDNPIVLTCAGQVLTTSQSVTANTSTKAAQYIALCNPLARAVDLTEVEFDGYQDITAWKTAGGFSSSFIQIINNKAVATAKYTWVDEYDKVNAVWLGGYWRDDLTGKKVVKVVSDPDTEETASIPAGQGLWCNVGKGAKDLPIYIVWPKLEGTAE